MQSFIKDFSMTAAVAGFLAVILAFASSSVLIFQAAKLAGLNQEITASWIWAVSMGSGVTTLFLSWKMKVPIINAWSTPGAALLITMLPSVSFSEAIGAYMVSALIIILIGITGSLDALIKKIPKGICAGLLAGILLNFCTKIFSSFAVDPLLAISMFFIFIIVKRLSPRYAVIAVLVLGVAICAVSGKLQTVELDFSLTTPVFTSPSWSIASIISIGIPLALVTLTGQYISGMAVLHASGYQVASGGIMMLTGLASFLLAPFSCHAVNLSSLTAAICTGNESNKNPSKRYVAGIICGVLYIMVGLFGTTIALLFSALPPVYVSAIAGLALLSAFNSGFSGILQDEKNIEAGIITFLTTSSGMQLLGLGSPFWGLITGFLTYIILKKE